MYIIGQYIFIDEFQIFFYIIWQIEILKSLQPSKLQHVYFSFKTNTRKCEIIFKFFHLISIKKIY